MSAVPTDSEVQDEAIAEICARELRDGFAGIVARAVDASGQDYGTLLAMKDIK